MKYSKMREYFYLTWHTAYKRRVTSWYAHSKKEKKNDVLHIKTHLGIMLKDKKKKKSLHIHTYIFIYIYIYVRLRITYLIFYWKLFIESKLKYICILKKFENVRKCEVLKICT